MSVTEFWVLTILLGAGTFLIRFSFLGFLGRRQLPEWLLEHLRFVGVAVFPAMVAPMILWPSATGGTFDPTRAVAAILALAAAARFGVGAAIVVGMGSLWSLQTALG
ncbi:MAG: AzlD domain-containing protein [Paracoccaceae bacterium]|nr:MAG: AzlD domain-containing protein [Paracoccaceae bacterium]